ncbi:MAG: M15 family metallopeptidase [Nocardioidaceae bacterium]
MRRVGVRGVRVGVLLVCLALPVTACSSTPDRLERTSAAQRTGASEPPAATAGGAAATDDAGHAVADPGSLRLPLLTADVLVTSTRTIPDAVRRRVRAVSGVKAAMPMSLSSVSANGRTLTVAGADPAQFRRFTQYDSARSNAVWKRVAGGEVAVDPALPRRLEDPSGYLRLGSAQTAPELHIGAYAPLISHSTISAVVDYERARQLGMPVANALLVSTGTTTPSALTSRLEKVLGPDTTMQTLALEFDVGAPQTAVLSGGSVSRAVGTFSYTPHPNGTVTPDPRWVSRYITRETMPIIGPVTGNRGMLPQLRAALDEVVRRGLTSAIHPSEYAGCYVPRFIANDPAKGLSLHSWGMAVDLNVPGNQRGTVGEMDRRVVSIFKRWGFAWGGDWNYTDPMHFEMARVVQAG